MIQTRQTRQNEQGNVLFLILIAVALFAALSYAVTQSTRSGGGSAEKETAILNSASMTQYPTSIRTSLVRMILAGTGVDNLEFNPPSDFASVTSNTVSVFHPDGGGAVFQSAATDLMANGNQGTWTFNANFNVPEIGISTAGAGNDVIAFLRGVTTSVCTRANTELGVTTTNCALNGGVPTLLAASTAAEIDILMDNLYDFDAQTTDAEVIQGNDSGGTCRAFTGQPSGCFYDGTDNVFYSVLLER